MKNQDKLNKMCPAFQKTQGGIAFGDLMVSIITLLNEVKSDFASLKTQFDDLVTDLNDSTTNIGNFVTNINAQKGNYDKLRKMLINACMDKGGLAKGTTTTQPKTVNSVDFRVNGVLYTKAATDPLGAFSDGFLGLEINQEAYYLMLLDDQGAFTTLEGTIVAKDAGCVLPEVPADKCAIGAIKVVTTDPGTFTPNTDDLDDTGDKVVTFEDLAMMHNGDGFAGASSAFSDGGAASTRVCPAIAAPAIKTLD